MLDLESPLREEEDLLQYASDPAPRDRRFDPHRVPLSTQAKALVDEACRGVERYEEHFGLRQRRRRKADQITFESTVSAILCDVIHHHVGRQDGGIYVSRSKQELGKRCRYKPSALNEKLPCLLDILASRELGYIKQNVGTDKSSGPARRTTIRAGWRTLRKIAEYQIALEDISQNPHREPIELRTGKGHFWDLSERIDYEDDDQTHEFRGQMEEINAWLASADMTYCGSTITDWGQCLTIHDRSLRRIFTRRSFEQGGRLFGGFWQSLSKADRKKNLMIETETAVELDYGQMCPRIAYGLAGVHPLMEDAYSIPGYEDRREGIKKVFNAMLFSEKRLGQFPQHTRPYFGPQPTIHQVTSAIEQTHPCLFDSFYTGAGYYLQFRESQILVDLLLRLKARSIVALPIHDAVLVAASRVNETRQLMLKVFRDHTGIEGLVSVG